MKQTHPRRTRGYHQAGLDYGAEITSDKVAKEMNGYDLTTGKLAASFIATLKNDGTTSSGNCCIAGNTLRKGRTWQPGAIP